MKDCIRKYSIEEEKAALERLRSANKFREWQELSEKEYEQTKRNYKENGIYEDNETE